MRGMRFGTAEVAAAAFAASAVAMAPAASADPIDNVDGGASGVSATVNLGIVTVNLPPTPSVTLPPGGGNVSSSLAKVNVPGVVSTGVLNTHTEGAVGDNGFSHSTASVADPDVLSGLATADVISSECTSGQAGSAGASTLVDADVLGNPLLNISPPPNTTLGIPGVVTATLNGQTGSTTPDATQLAVRALEVNVLQQLNVADVVVSESDCSAHFVSAGGGAGGVGGPGVGAGTGPGAGAVQVVQGVRGGAVTAAAPATAVTATAPLTG